MGHLSESETDLPVMDCGESPVRWRMEVIDLSVVEAVYLSVRGSDGGGGEMFYLSLR